MVKISVELRRWVDYHVIQFYNIFVEVHRYLTLNKHYLSNCRVQTILLKPHKIFFKILSTIINCRMWCDLPVKIHVRICCKKELHYELVPRYSMLLYIVSTLSPTSQINNYKADNNRKNIYRTLSQWFRKWKNLNILLDSDTNCASLTETNYFITLSNTLQ
jgi:hypothetical protein